MKIRRQELITTAPENNLPLADPGSTIEHIC
jgi:hypothetical protein